MAPPETKLGHEAWRQAQPIPVKGQLIERLTQVWTTGWKNKCSPFKQLCFNKNWHIETDITYRVLILVCDEKSLVGGWKNSGSCYIEMKLWVKLFFTNWEDLCHVTNKLLILISPKKFIGRMLIVWATSDKVQRKSNGLRKKLTSFVIRNEKE